MKAKELDAEFFRIQERLFPLSWGLAYVSITRRKTTLRARRRRRPPWLRWAS